MKTVIFTAIGKNICTEKSIIRYYYVLQSDHREDPFINVRSQWLLFLSLRLKFRHIYFVITNNIRYRSKSRDFQTPFPSSTFWHFTCCMYRSYNYYLETTFLFSNKEYCRENNFQLAKIKNRLLQRPWIRYCYRLAEKRTSGEESGFKSVVSFVCLSIWRT